MRATLARIPGVAIHDLGAERCGIVTLTVAGKDPAALQKALAAQAINVTVSSRASTLFDMQARGLDTVLRASVHYYNSEDEIARFAAAIAALARK